MPYAFNKLCRFSQSSMTLETAFMLYISVDWEKTANRVRSKKCIWPKFLFFFFLCCSRVVPGLYSFIGRLKKKPQKLRLQPKDVEIFFLLVYEIFFCGAEVTVSVTWYVSNLIIIMTAIPDNKWLVHNLLRIS